MKSFGFIKEVFTINYKYTGKGVSINDFYANSHWSNRNKLVNKYHKIFNALILESKIKKLNEFGIVIIYNSRHDPDNITGYEKLFTDCLKKMGIIVDDNKKHYKIFSVIPDESLEMNTIIFKVLKIS